MTWYKNIGKPPRDKTVRLAIRWANGMVDRWTYTAGQLRWDLSGHPFDVGQFAKVEA